MHGHPDGQVIALVHAAQCPPGLVQALGRLSNRLNGDFSWIFQLAVGVIPKQDFALKVCNEQVGVNTLGKRIEKRTQYFCLQHIAFLAALCQETACHIRDGAGILQQQFPLLLTPIPSKKDHHHASKHNKA